MRRFSMLVILFSFSTSGGWSQTPFFPFEETFDGPIDDDEPVSWRAGGLPPTLTAGSGELTLTDPIQLDGFTLGLTVIWKDEQLIMVQDASVQTVLRLSDPAAFAGCFTRGQGEDGDGGAYFGNISGTGTITVGSFTGVTLTLDTALDPTTNDIVFQLDTFGNQVTASAWNANEPRPDSPASITFTDMDDADRPAGFSGQAFGANGFGDDATGVSATFRSFRMSSEPLHGQEFVRGDANRDGRVDISDATRILDYLFGTGTISCKVAADGNDDNRVDIADAIWLLGFLFQGGPPPSAPYPEPSLDILTPGPLGCRD